MKPIMLNSINDISRQKPGLYSIPFKSNGRTFNFLVNIGNIDENASMTLQGYGQGGTGRNVLEFLNGKEWEEHFHERAFGKNLHNPLVRRNDPVILRL